MDMVEIGRIRKAIQNEAFVQRVFTEAEQQYCYSRKTKAYESFAARFAGKEAVMKAFGTGLRGGRWTEIEILPDELGAPHVTLTSVPGFP